MAYFAELDENNIVLRVISVSNDVVPDPAPDNEQLGIDFIKNVLRLGGTWKQTSYSSSFRKNYAGIGHQFDDERDAFIAPKPSATWILNETTCRWEPPIPKPAEGEWIWNEAEQRWDELVIPSEPE